MNEKTQENTQGKAAQEGQTQTQTQGINDSKDGNSAEGEKEKTITELDRADQIAERQGRENDRREQLLEREEALAARRAVGGTTEAGQTQEKKEETPEEYTERIMRGDDGK